MTTNIIGTLHTLMATQDELFRSVTSMENKSASLANNCLQYLIECYSLRRAHRKHIIKTLPKGSPPTRLPQFLMFHCPIPDGKDGGGSGTQ